MARVSGRGAVFLDHAGEILGREAAAPRATFAAATSRSQAEDHDLRTMAKRVRNLGKANKKAG